MGSCVSSMHKTPVPVGSSALKLQMSSLVSSDHDNNNNKPSSIPQTPVKDTNNKPSTIIGVKSQVSPFTSVPSYRSHHGSKDEAFYDTQAWLDSDCEDDFYSVNGDFTPSRGNTPVHNAVGNSRFNRTFSPQVQRALFDGRPPLRSASSQSRGSTPLHRRNSSATSPLASRTSFEGAASILNPDLSSTTKKKKKLIDLFRESIRERANEDLAFTLAGYESTEANEGKPPRPKNGTPYISGTNSVSSSGKRTPAEDYAPEKEKPLKAAHRCFPRLVSSRSLRKESSLPVTKDDLKT